MTLANRFLILRTAELSQLARIVTNLVQKSDTYNTRTSQKAETTNFVTSQTIYNTKMQNVMSSLDNENPREVEKTRQKLSQQLLNNGKECAKLNSNLGHACFRLEEFESAANFCETAINFDSVSSVDRDRACFEAFTSYRKMGNFRKAEEVFQKCVTKGGIYVTKDTVFE